MEVNNSVKVGYSNAYPVKPEAAPKSEASAGEGKEASASKSDAFVKSEGSAPVTYSKPKKLTAEQLEAIENARAENMKNFVRQMLGDQVKNLGLFEGFDFTKYISGTDTPETAAAAIAEDGVWGVDAVATRLVDMAISLSGGDSSKAEMLREAVKKGFEAAGFELGGSLPQVCQDTYTETMKRFDYWEEHGSMDGYVMGKD